MILTFTGCCGILQIFNSELPGCSGFYEGNGWNLEGMLASANA